MEHKIVKDLLLLDTKLILKIPDASSAKEWNISFLKKNPKKLVKRSRTIENPNISDVKSVTIEHPKVSSKFSKTIKWAKKAS